MAKQMCIFISVSANWNVTTALSLTFNFHSLFLLQQQIHFLMKNVAADETVLETKPNNRKVLLRRNINPPTSSIKFALTNSEPKHCDHCGGIQKPHFQSSDESKMFNSEEITKLNTSLDLKVLCVSK